MRHAVSSRLCHGVLALLLLAGAARAQDLPMRRHGYFVPARNTYVPPRPDRLPTLTAGQQFLCFPDTQEALLYHEAGGVLMRRSDLVLKVLTLTRTEDGGGGKFVLHFALEGSGREVLLSTDEGDVTKLPGLKPLVEDDTLRRLRKKYVGRRVWPYGGLRVIGVTVQPNTGASYTVDNSRPLTLKRLVRVYNRPRLMPLKTDAGGPPTGIQTSNPLVAILDLPADAHWGKAMFVGPDDFAAQAQASPESVCLGFYSGCADDWDFERTFSLADLSRLHPRWPHAMRLGMTPDMAAWVRGWPPEYGTRAQLRHKAQWRYDSETPFSDWIFFKRGRVIAFGPDGRLP